MITGRKLQLARNILGYSQEYMATKLNLTQRTISKWESGEVKLSDEILEKYLGVLGKDEEWVENLEERINIVQSNNVYHDSNSGYFYIINYNNVTGAEIKEIMVSLAELIKSQQQLLEKFISINK